MQRRAHTWLSWAAVLGIGAALPSCGESEPPEGARPPGPSQPAAVAPASANEPGAKELLVRLRAHVLSGQGGAAVNQDVAFLQRLLWPALESADAQRASQTHVQLAHIAGDVGRVLALAPAQRAQVADPDAISLEIHGTWLAAAGLPPDDYRAWCSDAGATLLLRLRADRAKFFDSPPRREGPDKR